MNNDITLFEPTSRDMELDYPELKGYKELKDLTSREIRLCWLVGNRTSPLSSYEKNKRLKAAINQVYGRASMKRKEVVAMMEGNIPERILLGIQRMASFRPSVRLRAKLINEYIFDQLQEIINVTTEEKSAMDTDEKKRYADLVIKVSSELPEIVSRMEGGYGIKVKENKENNKIKASVADVMDRVDY
tara:strand:- start:2603 stop:3166 length:564 start_codon:yes stop_codon:yes gene_type:complete